MGSMIVATFTDRRPRKVQRVIFVDPAGFPMKHSTGEFLLHIPVLGEILFAFTAKSMLLNGVPQNFHEPERYPAYLEQFAAQMPCKRAILSTIRNVRLSDHVDTYKRLGKQRRHVKIVWGRADRVTPFRNSEAALDVFPNATLLTVENAGHAPHYEAPDAVNPELVRFLRGES